jgi:hypothetical protein
MDYRLRKFCVKHTTKIRSLNTSSEEAAALYEFITDKIYKNPYERRLKEQQEAKT